MCTRLIATAVALLSLTPPVSAQSDIAFPKEVYAARRERLAATTGNAVVVIPGRYLIGADGLFKQDPSFWYMTGVESPYAVLAMITGGGRVLRTALFLPRRHQFAGAQYPMLDEPFRRAVWNRPVRRLEPGDAAATATGITETHAIDDLVPRLREMASGLGTVWMPIDDVELYAPSGLARPLSLEQQFTRAVVEQLPGAKVENLGPALRRMRLVKDEHEVAALRRAAEISVEGLREAMRRTRPGMNDREVAGIMEHAWKRGGSPRAAFPPIVASGPNAMTFFTLMRENYNSVDRVMRAGDLLFLDYGAAEVKGYAADVCRTIPVSGRFTPEQRRYYDIVLEAQEAAIAAIRPGVMMVDVIKAAASVFRRHGLERYEDVRAMGEDRVWGIMPSPTHYLARDAGIVRYSPLGAGVRDLGHHIGLEVQDSRDYTRPLEPGMVVTIEPKIYIPELTIAIMIEDMILVTREGHENLSAGAPKRAEDVEREMRVAGRGSRVSGKAARR